jgi:hypothetical protein
MLLKNFSFTVNTTVFPSINFMFFCYMFCLQDECMMEGQQEAVGGEEEAENYVGENDVEATMNDETTTDSLESQTEGTTPAPVGSTTPGESETEEREIAGLVERELLKELLKERISKLSKNGYNGKK